MAVNLTCSFTTLCCVALWSFSTASGGIRAQIQARSCRAARRAQASELLSAWHTLPVLATYVLPPNSTMKPGFPVPMNTDNPGVRKAARFGVYRYNNSSNDLFLFKESQINKAMVQIVRGLKYMLSVEIERTVCEKREHSSLDSCHFQKEKSLQQMLKCYFEVWIMPWLHTARVPIVLCH